MPALHTLTAGANDLVRALMAVASHAGSPVGYNALMGLTGLAFGADFARELDPAQAEGEALAHLPEACKALGLQARVVQAETIEGGIVAAVREGIDAGFAVAVNGWPDGAAGWSVVAGYDLGMEVLCGWHHGHTGEAYIGKPPAGSVAVVVTGRQDPPEREESLREALQRGADGADCVRAAYEALVASLDDGWWDQAEQTQCRVAAMRHERATERLADARDSAAEFLQHCMDSVDPLVARWLLGAARAYEGVVEAIENRYPPVMEATALEALRTPEWRRQWRDEIQSIAKLDAEALDKIRRAFSAEVPPEDAVEPVP